MPRNRYAIRHGEFSNDRLPTDGGRESPIDYRRVVRAEFKSMVRENNSPAASSLPRNLGRGPRPESWLLATERIRDANLICGLPVCYGGRREQITQAAEKSHRGHNDDACLARSISVLLERVHVGFYLRCDVQIRNLGAQRGFDQGRGGSSKRSGAIYNSRCADKRAIQRYCVIDARRPHV